MMDKKALIKLAEIAGYKVKWVDCFEWEDPCFMIQDVDVHYWRPREDLNQAFEVLEAWRSKDDLRHYMISSPKLHSCIKFYDLDLYCYDSGGFIYTVKGEHEVLSEAICQAVLKANNEQGEQ
jgi:hypothetical protein